MYRELRELLEQIRDFGHAKDCNSSAPVYECGCYKKSQSELAEEALQILEDEDTPSLGELLNLDEC